jgi:hypothetical protein
MGRISCVNSLKYKNQLMVSQKLLNLELKNYKTILNHLNFSFMKKIILLILLSFISFAGFAQDINEGFEGAPATADAAGVGHYLLRQETVLGW